MLKISKVKIDLISDPEMSNFFRDSVRGGMSFIPKNIPNLVIVKCLKNN